MKKLESLYSEQTLFKLLRIAAVAAGVLGTLLAVWLLCVGGTALSFGMNDHEAIMVAASATGLITVAVVSVCCWWALIVFYRMAGRLSRGSAFTQENERALGTIAAALAVSAAALTAAFVLLMVLCRGPVISVYAVLAPALVFGGLALIAYTLCRLVRRAATLQRDSDLTI